MKKILFLIFAISFYTCVSRKQTFKNLNKIVYKKQNTFDRRIASSNFYNRIKLRGNLAGLQSDTIFIIERVDEPTLKSEGAIWNEKRNVVFLFEETGIINTRKGAIMEMDTMSIRYENWKDLLKDNVERFDTASIDKHEILGGYRTFITQIIHDREVKTFFFHDSQSSSERPSFLKP